MLETPQAKGIMPTIDSRVDPDRAFDALRRWWPTVDPTRKKAETIDVLHDYFKEVESPRLALYASDEILVSGLAPRVAQKLSNVAAAGKAPAASLKNASEAQEARWQSPAAARASGAAGPDKSVRLRVYMYNDPLAGFYQSVIQEATSSKKAGLVGERCHVLDAEAATRADLDVQRTLFSFEADGPENGINVIPDTWRYQVGNLVRKAAFANRHITLSNLQRFYPDDVTLDHARNPSNTDKKSPEYLIANYEDDTYKGVKSELYELRIRQAQALRYAAQWARAQLAARKNEKLGVSSASADALIGELYDATTAAIEQVGLRTTPDVDATARKLQFLDLSTARPDQQAMPGAAAAPRRSERLLAFAEYKKRAAQPGSLVDASN